MRCGAETRVRVNFCCCCCCEGICGREEESLFYLVFAYAAEYVLAPVTAFPVGSDCGLLRRLGGSAFVLGKAEDGIWDGFGDFLWGKHIHNLHSLLFCHTRSSGTIAPA